MITKEIAMSLTHRDILLHVTRKGSDRQPVRARVNGRCQTWTTRPEDFRVPMKYGLTGTFQLTPHNAADWETPAQRTARECAANEPASSSMDYGGGPFNGLAAGFVEPSDDEMEEYEEKKRRKIQERNEY